MEINITVKPHPLQKEILDDPHRFKHVRAGRRFGKTWLAMYTAMIKGLSKNNQVIWYVSNDLKHCKETAIPFLFSMLPKVAIKDYKVQEMCVVLITGSTIWFKTSGTEEDLRGRGVDFIILEEFAFTPRANNLWWGILRPSLADRKGGAMFISTPEGNNEFKRLEDLCQTDPEWKSWHYTIYDNPNIAPDEVESIHRNTPDVKWRQEYLAEYIEEQGTVYYEFDPTVHVVSQAPKPIIARVRGMDWGIDDNTTAAVVNLLEDRSVYISHEYETNNTPIPLIANAVRSMLVAPFRATVMDSSAFRRESDFSSVTERFAQCGIPMEPATKDFDGSVSGIKELLTANRIYIDKSCSAIIRYMQDWNYGSHEPDLLAGMRYGIWYLVDNGGVKLPRYDLMAAEKPQPNMQVRTLKQFRDAQTLDLRTLKRSNVMNRFHFINHRSW